MIVSLVVRFSYVLDFDDYLVGCILKIRTPEDAPTTSWSFCCEVLFVCFCHLPNKPFFNFVGVVLDEIKFVQLFKELLGLDSENFFFVGFHFSFLGSWVLGFGYGN